MSFSAALSRPLTGRETVLLRPASTVMASPRSARSTALAIWAEVTEPPLALTLTLSPEPVTPELLEPPEEDPPVLPLPW